MQIGNRVRRLERARLAADRKRIKRLSDMPVSDEHTDMNLETRYELPNSRNNPVNIYNFVRAHHGDPATAAVCLPFEH
jgi:hypothetical protein